jgi:hypothetical protein
MTTTVDQFDGWRRLLKGEKVDLNQDHPLSGYWRSRQFKGGPLEPVAIWKDDDGINVQFIGKDVPYERVWPWCARSPVSYAAFKTRMETGKWSDIDDVAHSQQEANREAAGSNNPPTDPAELLKEQIDSAKAGASVYAIIDSDEKLTKAQTLRSRLLELSGQADKQREEAKKPHLTAAKLVDDRWMPLVKASKACADAIRTAMELWDTKKLQARRAEEAKIAEAERARLAAIARATKEAAEAGKPVPPPPPPVQQLPLPPAPTTIRGAAGRAASSKPKMVIDKITNVDAVFYFLKDHPEVMPWLKALAQRAIDAGKNVPGVELKEVAVVK